MIVLAQSLAASKVGLAGAVELKQALQSVVAQKPNVRIGSIERITQDQGAPPQGRYTVAGPKSTHGFSRDRSVDYSAPR